LDRRKGSIGHRLLHSQIIETDSFDVHLIAQFLQLQLPAIFALYAPVQLIDILLLPPLVDFAFVLEGVDLHVVERYGHIQVDEIIRRPKFLPRRALNDLYSELLPNEVKHPPPLDRFFALVVTDPRFEGLYLKFLGPRRRQLDSHILIEGNRHEVGLPRYFFLSVFLEDELLFGVPVQPFEQHVLQMFVMREDEKIDAEHSVDPRTQVLEINIRKIFYLELHASRNEDLLRVLVDVQHPETLLEVLHLDLTLQLCHYRMRIFIRLYKVH